MMRINIVIDEKLMREGLQATGLNKKREVVEQGLRLIRLEKRAQIRMLRRRVQWEGDLDVMKTDQ